jgi:hypothetical protein
LQVSPRRIVGIATVLQGNTIEVQFQPPDSGGLAPPRSTITPVQVHMIENC